MPEDTNEKIWVVTAAEVPVANKRIQRGLSERGSLEVIQAVSVSALKKNVQAFFLHLQEIIGPAKDKIGEFELSRIEITAQVTGEGKVCLLGTGAKMEAQCGIKFVLNRTTE